jgi:zinc transport system permease protein
MPAAISGLFVKDMKKMMIWAIVLSTAFTVIGLFLSYYLNLTSGATIILVSGAVYLLSLATKSLAWRTNQMTVTGKRLLAANEQEV